MKPTIILPAMLAMILLLQHRAMAHAFLDHANPPVGSHLKSPPTEVKIWFTEEIEPAFSKIEVTDSDGKQVDNKDSHADDKDKTLFIVSLQKLSAGTYKVHWHVVASDTHRTQGDFSFTVSPPGG
jgi:methionine-rich copper-binding protein CopC